MAAVAVVRMPFEFASSVPAQGIAVCHQMLLPCCCGPCSTDSGNPSGVLAKHRMCAGWLLPCTLMYRTLYRAASVRFSSHVNSTGKSTIQLALEESEPQHKPSALQFDCMPTAPTRCLYCKTSLRHQLATDYSSWYATTTRINSSTRTCMSDAPRKVGCARRSGSSMLSSCGSKRGSSISPTAAAQPTLQHKKPACVQCSSDSIRPPSRLWGAVPPRGTVHAGNREETWQLQVQQTQHCKQDKMLLYSNNSK